jgi:hypothetical protein
VTLVTDYNGGRQKKLKILKMEVLHQGWRGATRCPHRAAPR